MRPGLAGAALGALHASICGLPRVNDIAVGIALMLFGTGLAFFLGKPLIEPTAPHLPSIDFGWWSDIPQVRAALRINVLFLIGVALAPALVWALRTTRAGLIVRTAGESADAARAMGYSVNAIRMRATMFGGFLAGIGGSFLSLFYPGSWNEGLSSGQGITAVALVIFARWDPMLCLLGVVVVRRRRRARAGVAVGRRQPGLSSLQRGPVCADAADHDHHLLAQAHVGGCARRAVDHEIEDTRSIMTERYVAADPYPWPYNGDLRPQNTALIIIDMQTDFCGIGGYVDRMGYDLSLTRAPIEPIKRTLAADARARVSHPAYARRPSSRPLRSAGQQALALAQDRRRHRRSGTLRPHPGARRSRLGDHSRSRAQDGEPIIDKPGKGSFCATDLELILRCAGSRTSC